MNTTQMENTILQVPIEDIIPNRFQPRLSFDDASLNDLASSIKQHGIIQPLVLRRKGEKFEIIAGERRYKAARLAGLASVPAVISNLSDNESAEVAIVENVQRKDLTAIEEARSYQALLDKGYMTQDELAKKMGLSQSAISNKLRLLSLDESVQKAILEEKISERHARSLLKVSNKQLQIELLNKIINERLTVKQLEEEIRKMNGNDIMNNDVEDVPVVNTGPNIANIVNNSIDIAPVNFAKPQQEFMLGETEKLENATTPIKNDSVSPAMFFGSPEKTPNKFFNFLEDEAANMNTEEETYMFDLSKGPETQSQSSTDLLNNKDDIEMLDDFFIPQSPTNTPNTNNEYLNQVIKTIRGLNLDSDKVVIEEINLPTEYHITIKIKKDNV